MHELDVLKKRIDALETELNGLKKNIQDNIVPTLRKIEQGIKDIIAHTTTQAYYFYGTVGIMVVWMLIRTRAV